MGTLVVVEADTTGRQMVLSCLTARGYAVKAVETEAQALDLLASEAIDLVLLDQEIQATGGIEFLDAMRQQSPTLPPPVILMTAPGALHVAATFIQAGAADYVEKPLHLDLLEVKIRRSIDSTRRLRHEIAERGRAEAELRRTTDDLKTFLYATSHDLRSPLWAIESFSRLVLERYGDRLEARGQDFLRRVVRAAERLDRLLTDILTLSRASRAEPSAEIVEAEHLVREVLRQLASPIQETCAQVQVAPDLPRFSAHATWAAQAVYHLVANALKFTREGAAPEVEVAPYRVGGEVGLVVRDRGPGVASAHAERIFKLFQREVGRDVEGTGAGLAIVRQIAERHGGNAWVQPREGGGSEFVITFGAAEETSASTLSL